MQSRMMIENPGDVEVTLKLTMPVRHWEELRDQLERAYPSWQLSEAITNMLSQVRKIVYPEPVQETAQ